MAKRRFIVTAEFKAWRPGSREYPEKHLAMRTGFDLFAEIEPAGEFIIFDMDAGQFEAERRTFLSSTTRYSPDKREEVCQEPSGQDRSKEGVRPNDRPNPHYPKAFVSHATADHPFVERFAADLRENGVDAWFSKWEIKPGDSIPAKIDEGLEDCEFFIIVLSKNSINRPWVQTELDAATIRKLTGKVRKIIPVKIEDCGDLPPTLGALLWEDFSNQTYESALNRVLYSIFDMDVRPPLGQAPVASNPAEQPAQPQRNDYEPPNNPQAGSQEHGPVLELSRGDPTVQINNLRYFYSLTLTNTQDDFEAPALDVKAELSFRHKKAAEVGVRSALLMDRHTLDRQDVITCVFPSLKNRQTIEIVLVGQSKDYMRFHTMRCPLSESTADETDLALGNWTCNVRVTACYDHEGVRRELVLDSEWTVKISLGHLAEIKLRPPNQASDENGGLFIRTFLWNGQGRYRCSVCEFDNQDRTIVEEHTRLNHGFAVGEEQTSTGLNLLIANASGTPLSDLVLTLVDFKQWDKGLGQFCVVYELRDFQPVELRGNYSPIYVGKPAIFQLVDAVHPGAPTMRSVVGSDWVVPSHGIWRADFELHRRGRNPTRFYKCLAWDGRSNPKFVLCP